MKSKTTTKKAVYCIAGHTCMRTNSLSLTNWMWCCMEAEVSIRIQISSSTTVPNSARLPCFNQSTLHTQQPFPLFSVLTLTSHKAGTVAACIYQLFTAGRCAMTERNCVLLAVCSETGYVSQQKTTLTAISIILLWYTDLSGMSKLV